MSLEGLILNCVGSFVVLGSGMQLLLAIETKSSDNQTSSEKISNYWKRLKANFKDPIALAVSSFYGAAGVGLTLCLHYYLPDILKAAKNL